MRVLCLLSHEGRAVHHGGFDLVKMMLVRDKLQDINKYILYCNITIHMRIVDFERAARTVILCSLTSNLGRCAPPPSRPSPGQNNDI
jgi:hypothetical protein